MEYLLTPAEIKKAVANADDKEGMSLAARFYLGTLSVAQAQLKKCEDEAKPVWQREAVEMVFEGLREYLFREEIILSIKTAQRLKQEILAKIDDSDG